MTLPASRPVAAQSVSAPTGRTVHPVFQYPLLKTRYCADFLDSYLRELRHSCRIYRGLNLAYAVFGWLLPVLHCRYVFVGSMYADIIEHLKNRAALVGNLKCLRFALRYRSTFAFAKAFECQLGRLYLKDPLLAGRRAQRLMRHIQALLRRIDPGYLVVSNDSLFLERFFVVCARELGIRTICIQHGLFHEATAFETLDGFFADYMFVWGPAMARIYETNGYDMRKMRVLGYHSNVPKAGAGAIRKDRICILGEALDTHNVRLAVKSKATYESACTILRESDKRIQIYYKPHPAEKDEAYRPAGVTLFRGNLKQSMQFFDVFVGTSSSAILEASLNGKIGIQIYDREYAADNFQDMGYAYSLPVEALSDLAGLLRSVDRSYTMQSTSIATSSAVGARFDDLVATLV